MMCPPEGWVYDVYDSFRDKRPELISHDMYNDGDYTDGEDYYEEDEDDEDKPSEEEMLETPIGEIMDLLPEDLKQLLLGFDSETKIGDLPEDIRNLLLYGPNNRRL